MNKYYLPVVLLCALGLSACAIGYQARGRISDVSGEMRGKGYPNLAGGGRFIFSDPSGTVQCDGIANPPKGILNPESCLGEKGTGKALCTDGREFLFSWAAVSCRAWKGSGTDAKGNQLEFRVERN